MADISNAEVPNTELPNNALAMVTNSTHAELHARVLALLDRCHKEDENFGPNRYLYTREIYHILLGNLH